jgi:hypothetical protein
MKQRLWILWKSYPQFLWINDCLPYCFVQNVEKLSPFFVDKYLSGPLLCGKCAKCGKVIHRKCGKVLVCTAILWILWMLWKSYPHFLWITRKQDELIDIISSSLCVHYVNLWKSYPHFLWITHEYCPLCGKPSLHTERLLSKNPHLTANGSFDTGEKSAIILAVWKMWKTCPQ